MNASPGYNVIVKDATSYIGYQDNTGSSWNHTIGSGKERILIVSVGSRGTLPSTVTFNGVQLTKAYESPTYDGCRASIWYLMNPDVGTHSIVVSSGSMRWIAGAISAFNVESRVSEIPYYRTGYDAANRSYASTTINNSIGGCLGVDAVFNTDASSSIGVGAKQTIIVKGDDTDAGGISYGLDLPIGNVAFSWTSFESSSTAFSQGVVMFLPSIKRSSLLGVFLGLMT